MKTKPDIGIQVFLSLCKWFFVFVIINNLIWAAAFMGYYKGTFDISGHSIEMTQDGYQNNQELNDGTAIN